MATSLVEDQRIRRAIAREFRFAGISKVEIERTGAEVLVIIHSAKPGLIIGRKGAKVDRLREELEQATGKTVRLNIVEMHRPELSAQLVAESVAEQLEKRASFRRTMKRAIELTMSAGAKGCKVQVAGRLGRLGDGAPGVAGRGLDPAVDAQGADRLRVCHRQDGLRHDRG
ncbi:MAG: hypothetical protein KatS3mg102_0977 [Planctomycetota bacterium]|nr:MAG: hypothetical protein KatS3mg102_0977 [Planctomycetota bacterium]